jgi:S-adenosylmethionine hydrolase
VSHAIHPQAIERAVFVLATTWPYFPPGTIHVAVVGSEVQEEDLSALLEP